MQPGLEEVSSDNFQQFADDELKYQIAGLYATTDILYTRKVKLDRLYEKLGLEVLQKLIRYNIVGDAFDQFIQLFPYSGTGFERLQNWSYLENIREFAKFWRTRHQS